ncbi:MAG: hypothetical protein WKF30_12735, partial [Pyrinomonadaceae bacterium]
CLCRKSYETKVTFVGKYPIWIFRVKSIANHNLLLFASNIRNESNIKSSLMESETAACHNAAFSRLSEGALQEQRR